MNLIKSNGHQSSVVTLTKDQQELCNELSKINRLRDYKLTDMELIGWADSICATLEVIHLPAIKFAIDKMISGEIEYDRNLGVKNIFEALKRIRRTDKGFEVKNFTW